MLTLLSGCSEFFDINTDPNNPTEVGLQLILPAAQQGMAGYLGVASTGLGTVPSIYTHQFVTRGTELNDYAIAGTDFEIDRPWEGLYSNSLVEFQTIIDNGTESGDRVYVGIAKIMKAYTYSIMVDIWGDIPFSEALIGAENRNPVFEDGATIYPQLFTMLDEGISDIQSNEGLPVGGDDFIYGGNGANWVRFANTVKLKLYNQIRLRSDVSAQVNELITAGNMIGPGDDFEFPYGTNSNPDNRNPGYVKEYGGNAYYISPFFYEIMVGTSDENPILNGIEDPRVPYYFYNQLAPGEDAQNPVAYQNGEFLSIWMFSFNIDPNEGFDQAQSQTLAGLYPVGGKYDDGSGANATISSGRGDAPSRMLPYYAHLYIRAELAATGVTAESSRDLFEAAMTESFAKVNEIAANAGAPSIADSTIAAYVADVIGLFDAADADGKLELIMTEKWIASFGWGIDAYTDYRRTGYPVLFDGNTDDNPFTVRGRDYPVSLPYQTDELNLNSNAPSQRVISRDKIFWDL
jgi:hypothetical protein